MTSPKIIALFLAFAVAAAALQPSEAARPVQAQQGLKPAAASHAHAAEKVSVQEDGGAPTPPGLPAGVQLPPGAAAGHPGPALPAAGRHHQHHPAAAPAAGLPAAAGRRPGRPAAGRLAFPAAADGVHDAAGGHGAVHGLPHQRHRRGDSPRRVLRRAEGRRPGRAHLPLPRHERRHEPAPAQARRPPPHGRPPARLRRRAADPDAPHVQLEPGAADNAAHGHTSSIVTVDAAVEVSVHTTQASLCLLSFKMVLAYYESRILQFRN
ncbi:hypothetical protein PVAP13_3NG079597 [Panicum virgatum]|uniref:Uncharacterized protein n=1 Tax=Panicum virgatum TaxID=38727 RepID=A0A8T0U1N2_PANVG|nr:hypothetical protein PVAP13_3NG079597 [Panicum virgatum]